MQCVVYVGGRIVKWYNGSLKNCMSYMHGAAEGLEASGARLSFKDEKDSGMSPAGCWGGWSANGKSVLIFVWRPS